MKIKFLNQDLNVIEEIESNTNLEGSIKIIDSITSYIINNEEYRRTDEEIGFDIDTNSLEVSVKNI